MEKQLSKILINTEIGICTKHADMISVLRKSVLPFSVIYKSDAQNKKFN